MGMIDFVPMGVCFQYAIQEFNNFQNHDIWKLPFKRWSYKKFLIQGGSWLNVSLGDISQKKIQIWVDSSWY